MFRRSCAFTSLFLLALLIAGPAYAELQAVGAVFPTNPNDAAYNGFPQWYRDSTGITLELPNPPVGDGLNAPTMIFDPIDMNNGFSAQIGFGTEAFYYLASSLMNMSGGRKADLRMGIEAAFAAGDAVDGDQITFSRIRIRVDVPIAGTYTVTHPYGQRVYRVTTPGRRAINETIDIGVSPGVFTGALRGAIGPFLRATTLAPGVSPTEWIGDGATETTVTGSPTGFNKFRVDGPAGSNLGGPGINFVETDLFVVSGKIFTGTPFSMIRATYSRNASGTSIDVWARIPPPLDAGVVLSAQYGTDPAVAMVAQGSRFFVHLPVTTLTLPGTVKVTGTTSGLNPTTLEEEVTDLVSITQATYSLATKNLNIAATSSDTTAGTVLTAAGWGASLPVTGGALTVNLPTPPPTVTVRSSRGGSLAIPVVILP